MSIRRGEILDIFTDHTGEDRVLGHVPPSPLKRRGVKAGPRLAVLPESQWQEFLITDHPVQVKDQNGKGACNGHAAAESLEFARWVAGLDYVELSAWFVYAILCGGRDVGSNIGDALALLKERGAPPDSDVAYGTINPNKLSAAAKANALRNRIEIGSPLTTGAELMTAVQLRKPFNFSVCVGAGFDQLDADGCVRLGRGFDNHAVCGTATGAKRCKNGDWAFLWLNSWSARWGDGGYAWVRVKDVARGNSFEAYSVDATDYDPQGQEPPAAV